MRGWVLAASASLGHNEATVALANQLVRYAWAVASPEAPFETRAQAV